MRVRVRVGVLLDLVLDVYLYRRRSLSARALTYVRTYLVTYRRRRLSARARVHSRARIHM